MKTSTLLPALAAFALLAGCATQPPRLAKTPWPQAVINAPQAKLHDRFLAAVASTGGTIESSTDSLIQARYPDDHATMQKLFFGCASCADPYIHLNIVMAPAEGGTLVVVQYWRMIPQPNDNATRYEISDNESFNQAQKMLWKVRDSFAGTQTPDG